MVEWSLSKPEIRCSNPKINKIDFPFVIVVWFVTEKFEGKRGPSWPSIKS